jgi:glycosyltransferase involved in cell wall biosynthesis
LLAGSAGGEPAGVLHAPADPDDLARAIIEMLNDEARAARLGRRGHEVVRERHTFDTMAAGHEAVYAGLK